MDEALNADLKASRDGTSAGLNCKAFQSLMVRGKKDAEKTCVLQYGTHRREPCPLVLDVDSVK